MLLILFLCIWCVVIEIEYLYDVFGFLNICFLIVFLFILDGFDKMINNFFLLFMFYDFFKLIFYYLNMILYCFLYCIVYLKLYVIIFIKFNNIVILYD